MSETAAASNVPVSAMSAFANTHSYTAVVIGKNYLSFLANNPPNPSIWLVVVDLTNLSVVVNVATNSVTVPPQVQQYVGNPRYFLFCISNSEYAYNLIHGPLYALLKQVGSGPQLDRLEQLVGQLGTNTILNYSYILAATMDTTDYPGFEAVSITGPAVLGMAFMPITINNQTTYSPINPFGS